MSLILPTGGVLRSTPAFAVVILAAGASRRPGRSKALVQRAGQALRCQPADRSIAAGAVWGGATVDRLATRPRKARTGRNTHLPAVAYERLIPLEISHDGLDTPADLANLQRRWPSWRRAAR